MTLKQQQRSPSRSSHIPRVWVALLLLSLLLNFGALVVFYQLERSIQLSARVSNYFGLALPGVLDCRHPDLDYHSISDPRIRVHGIAGFYAEAPVFDRLEHMHLPFRDGLRRLGAQTAGVRLRFMTDSEYLGIDVSRLRQAGLSYPTLSVYGASGVDIYADGGYLESLAAADCGELLRLRTGGSQREPRLIEIYLPNYSPAKVTAIGLAPGSRLERAAGYRASVAFYGTSITQGEGASRPSLSYPAILSRTLGADFYNLGFSGNARGDAELAELLSQLDVDAIVLEYARQAVRVEGRYEANLERFMRILRAGAQHTPVIIVSAFFDLAEASGQADLAERRQAFRTAFEQLRQSDPNLYFVDGVELLGPADQDGFADQTHPNTHGATLIARRLAPWLESVLPAAKVD